MTPTCPECERLREYARERDRMACEARTRALKMEEALLDLSNKLADWEHSAAPRKHRAYRRSLRLAKEQRRNMRRRLAISLACEGSLCEQLMHLDGANHELEASRASTLAVLRAVEWIRRANPLDRNDVDEFCPRCGKRKDYGHAPGCTLDAKIKELEGGK